MKKYFFLTSTFILTLTSCKVTEDRVVGNYTSNYQDKLTLNPDKTFKIEYDLLDTVTFTLKTPITIDGHWTLSGKGITLTVNNKKYKYWECWGLAVKRHKLKRPVECGPTHRFLFFTKTN